MISHYDEWFWIEILRQFCEYSNQRCYFQFCHSIVFFRACQWFKQKQNRSFHVIFVYLMKSHFKFFFLFSFTYKINDLKKSKKLNVKIVIKIFFKFFQIWKHFSFEFKIRLFFIEIVIDSFVFNEFLILIRFVYRNRELFFTKLFLKFKIFSFNKNFFFKRIKLRIFNNNRKNQ